MDMSLVAAQALFGAKPGTRVSEAPTKRPWSLPPQIAITTATTTMDCIRLNRKTSLRIARNHVASSAHLQIVRAELTRSHPAKSP